MEKLDPKILYISPEGETEHIKESFLQDPKREVYFNGNIAVVGNNNASPIKRSFRDRAVYKAFGTPIWVPRGFDFLDKNLFFGKVDMNNRAILPKQSSLEVVPYKFAEVDNIYINKNLLELYIKFYEEFRIAFATNQQGVSMFLNVFRIAKGAERRRDIEESYIEYASDSIYQTYVEQVIDDSTNIKDTAKDFFSYLNIVVKLVKLNKIKKDVLFNEYILSTKNSVLNSGLIFETSNLNETPYDDNAAKYKDFFQYAMYNRVISFLVLNGIRYDANAPWRFAMDLNLKPIKEHLKGITKEKFFEDNFDVIEGSQKEKNLFFESIFQSYLILLKEEPVYFTSGQKMSTCKSIKISTAQSFDREIYSEIDFKELYNKNFNIYLLRYAEMLNYLYGNRTNINQILLDIAYKEKKGLDKEDLVRYTFNKMKYC